MLWRLGKFIVWTSLAFIDQSFCLLILRRTTARDRALWVHRWMKRFTKYMHVEAHYHGTPPIKGVLCCNHVSYLDIFILSANQPMTFVAKKEVSSWPLIGFLSRMGGTLFIDRKRKSEVFALAPQFNPIVDQEVVLVIFPEGTSTGGDRVMPFMSSLLEPAVQNKWPITSAWIGYTLTEGDPANDVCYWRDMTFFPHLLNLLSLKSIRVDVVYNAPLPPGLDRKQLAVEMHAQVENVARERGYLKPQTVTPATLAEQRAGNSKQ